MWGAAVAVPMAAASLWWWRHEPPPIAVSGGVAYAVTASGIWFVHNFRTIEFYDFAAGRTTTIFTLAKQGSSLAVSPDGTFVVYGQSERNDVDLMLVDGFR